MENFNLNYCLKFYVNVFKIDFLTDIVFKKFFLT